MINTHNDAAAAGTTAERMRDQAADDARYAAKRAGKERVCFRTGWRCQHPGPRLAPRTDNPAKDKE
jgi:hypothetical protein